jgi:hypothetical protein
VGVQPALGVIGNAFAAANGSNNAGTRAAPKRACPAKDAKADRRADGAPEKVLNIKIQLPAQPESTKKYLKKLAAAAPAGKANVGKSCANPLQILRLCPDVSWGLQSEGRGDVYSAGRLS